MTVNSHQDTTVMQLRMHHISCMPKMPEPVEPSYWGPDYLVTRKRLKNIVLSQPETDIQVIEGVDELCRHCLVCVNNRCTSPRSGEDVLREQDASVLAELGLPLGTCLTAGEWQVLIQQKIPFEYCRECWGKQQCPVGSKLT